MGLLLVTALVPIVLIDLERRLIPNAITLPAAVAGVAAILLLDTDGIVEALIAGVAAGGFFLLAALVYPRGMGMGDVKLAGLLGLYLGRGVGPALFAALILGVLVGAVIIARKGAAAGRKTAVPFARSSLSAACWASSWATASPTTTPPASESDPRPHGRTDVGSSPPSAPPAQGIAQPGRCGWCAGRPNPPAATFSWQRAPSTSSASTSTQAASPSRRSRPGRLIIDRAAVADLEPGVVRDGEVTDVAGLSAALRDLWSSHKGLGKRVRIGVANPQIIMRVLYLPPVSNPKELSAAVLFRPPGRSRCRSTMRYWTTRRWESWTPPPARASASSSSLPGGTWSWASSPPSAGPGSPEGIDLSAFAMVRALHAPAPRATGALPLRRRADEHRGLRARDLPVHRAGGGLEASR